MAHHRSGTGALLLWLLLLSGASASAEATEATEAAVAGGDARPHIVLLVSDDHDYEQLGFMGSSIAHTPALDRLARAGSVFPRGYVPMSLCRPSLAALLSGRHPHQSGIYANYMRGRAPIGGDGRYLDPAGSLPRRLRDAGYATYAGGKFWEGDAREMGFTHGVARASYDSFESFVRRGQDELFAFIDEFAAERPMFISWAPMMPHVPHDPPPRFLDLVSPAKVPVPGRVAPRWRRAFVRAERSLLGMVAWLDDGVGALVSRLEQRGALANTLFAFLIDNGWSTDRPSKGTAFEKGLRTPVFFTWPGRVAAGARHPALVSSLDVFPTLLAYAGLPVPTELPGRNLRPVLEGAATLEDRPVIGAIYPVVATGGGGRPERDVLAFFLVDRGWKYVLYVKDFNGSSSGALVRGLPRGFPRRLIGDVDLHDLQADPYELRDLSRRPEHARRQARYRRQVFEWWLETGGRPVPAIPHMRRLVEPPDPAPAPG